MTAKWVHTGDEMIAKWVHTRDEMTAKWVHDEMTAKWAHTGDEMTAKWLIDFLPCSKFRIPLTMRGSNFSSDASLPLLLNTTAGGFRFQRYGNVRFEHSEKCIGRAGTLKMCSLE
eukprot:532381-Amorphochlora_amoeboformis.AAC.1